MIRERKISLPVLMTLLILFIIRIAWGVYLWIKADGMFILLRGDDMVRVLQGHYAIHRFSLIAPFSTFAPLIYAQGLKIYPDSFLIPSVINTIFGLGGVLALFFLTRKLFGDDAVTRNMIGLLAVGLIIFYPAFVWATLSGDRHSIFFFLVFIALFFWVTYLESGKRVWLLLAAVAFLFSTPTMHEGWIYTFIFAIFMLRNTFITYKNFRKIDLFPLICIFVASIYILMRLFYDYHHYGNALGYILERTNISTVSNSLSYRLVIYPSLLAKMFVFPILQLLWPKAKIYGYPFVIEQVIPFIFIFAIARWLCRAKKMERLIFDYTLIIVVLLLVNIVLAIIGVDTVGVPIPRQHFTNLFVFLPIVSFILYGLITSIFAKKRVFQFVSIAFLIGAISVVNILASLNPPKSQMRREAIQLGMLLRGLYAKEKLDSKDNILLEQRVEANNNSLAIEPNMLQIFAPERILFDREWKPILRKNRIYICDTRDNPSLFEDSINRIQDYIREKNFRIVIVRTDNIRAKIERIMEHAVNIGEYHIYVYHQDKELMAYIKAESKQLPIPWLGRDEQEEPLG